MLPRPSAEYVGHGPLKLARLTHEAEDAEDDVTFLAIQDAVATLGAVESEMYRQAYLEMLCPTPTKEDTHE